MGEGTATIIKGTCPYHGQTNFLYGYNQGGHDSVTVCLKCCVEVEKFLKEEKK